MQIERQRVRILFDAAHMDTPAQDVLRSATPQWWNGVDLQIEVGVSYDGTMVDLTNYSSLKLELKQPSPRTGEPLMWKTVASTDPEFTAVVSLANWEAGTAQHALVRWTDVESNLDLQQDSESYWLVLSGITASGNKVTLGYSEVAVVEDGAEVAPPSPPTGDSWLTITEADARYAASNLTGKLNLTGGTMTGPLILFRSPESDAEAATKLYVDTGLAAKMASAGGSFSGMVTCASGLTITGLTGVLKAAAGVVSGSATTDNLTEGATNLYLTTARVRAALSASGDITFTDGEFAFTDAVDSVNSLTGVVVLDTDDIAEGSTNLYHTTVRAAAAAPVQSVFSRTGAVVLLDSDITAALGFTPYSASNPDGYLDAITSADVTTALGYTPLSDAGDTLTGNLVCSPTGSNYGIRLAVFTSTYPTGATGAIMYDSNTGHVMVHNGSYWVAVGGGGGTGAGWYLSSADPENSIGDDGDFDLQWTSGTLFYKSAGAWSEILQPLLRNQASTLEVGAYIEIESNVDEPIRFKGKHVTDPHHFSINNWFDASDKDSLVIQCGEVSGAVIYLPDSTGAIDISTVNFPNSAGVPALKISGTTVVKARHTDHTFPSSVAENLTNVTSELNYLITALAYHGLIVKSA